MSDKLKTMFSGIFRDKTSGQYAHSKMDTMCKCGHRLGVHAGEKVAGVRPCFAGDIGVGTCECVTFRKAKAKT